MQFNRFIFNNATHWEAPTDAEQAAGPVLDPYHTAIKHLAIVYLGPKGPKVLEAERKDPNGSRFNVPDVWSDKDVLDVLRPRMQAWQMAWQSYPTWPAGLEDMPGWAGPTDWTCPGIPLCHLPNCMAKRYPNGLTWPSP